VVSEYGRACKFSFSGYLFCFKMPFSRKMETEADLIGLKLMAKACYDPHAAIGLWQVN
jgi:predicted Zn-dependent protease